MFNRFADNRNKSSVASQLRFKRFSFFLSLLERVPTPVSILDVGGTEQFWSNNQFLPNEERKVTIMNLETTQQVSDHFTYVSCDARMLPFESQSFDVVFSNSVIEHVGGFKQQKQMADEVMRVGKRYFIQTPNLYFPIEPHFVFPFFQFLPVPVRARLLSRFDLGWFPKSATYQDALKEVRSIRLLTRKELGNLFRNAQIYEETILGMRKSFMAYAGW
jgi:hypothetical protein